MSKTRQRKQQAVFRAASDGKDRLRCTYCGVAVSRKVAIGTGPDTSGSEPVWPFTMDHVVPRAKGGCDALVNLTASCEPCNTLKRDDDLVAFIERLGDRAVLTIEQAADLQHKAKVACGTATAGPRPRARPFGSWRLPGDRTCPTPKLCADQPCPREEPCEGRSHGGPVQP